MNATETEESWWVPELQRIRQGWRKAERFKNNLGETLEFIV